MSTNTSSSSKRPHERDSHPRRVAPRVYGNSQMVPHHNPRQTPLVTKGLRRYDAQTEEEIRAHVPPEPAATPVVQTVRVSKEYISWLLDLLHKLLCAEKFKEELTTVLATSVCEIVLKTTEAVTTDEYSMLISYEMYEKVMLIQVKQTAYYAATKKNNIICIDLIRELYTMVMFS